MKFKRKLTIRLVFLLQIFLILGKFVWFWTAFTDDVTFVGSATSIETPISLVDLPPVHHTIKHTTNTAASVGEIHTTTKSAQNSSASTSHHVSSSEVHNAKPSKTAYLEQMSCHIGSDTKMFPVFPHLIVIGAQKAGTTALHQMLRYISDFQGTKQAEAHFWDNHVMPLLDATGATNTSKVTSIADMTNDTFCQLTEKYYSAWNARRITKTRYLGEKTPILMAFPGLAPTMRAFLDRLYPPVHPVKILVLLREPVERLYSHYKMEYLRRPADKRRLSNFDVLMEDEVQKMLQKGAIIAPPYNRTLPDEVLESKWNPSLFAMGNTTLPNYQRYVERGLYADQVAAYMKHFPLGKSMMVVPYERLRDHPGETLQDIWEFVGGRKIAISKEAKNAFDSDLGPKFEKTREYTPPLKNHTKLYLQRLYKPFNDKLVDLLGESWRGIWGY